MKNERLYSRWLLGWFVLLIFNFQFSISRAESWKTHFAYNNVTKIAMSSDRVYALSDGSLYSVDKQSEKIRTYNRQSGLHGTGITCIYYDTKGKQLFIGYGNGKIDILSANGVRYVGDLYDKDMTQRKDIYNVTVQGRTAYISTHYGIQTFDLRELKLVDSYWLRANGIETPINDVRIIGDSIYAFSTDSMYCASMKTNLVDYTVWKREIRSGRISPDPDKGIHYTDAKSEWYSGGDAGIVRYTDDVRTTYKPEGPLYNTPYRINTYGKHVWVLPGGRWADKYDKPGVVMHFDGTKWTNIDAPVIQAKTGNPARDFMNAAVDPRNPNHYYVTSYGTGLYEFDHDTLIRQYLPAEDNTLVSAAASAPTLYTRLDYAQYDNENNLWFMESGSRSQLQCIDASGAWHAKSISVNNAPLKVSTPTGLILDNRNPNYKWMTTGRANTCICRLDDNGTLFDFSDDEIVHREQWEDQFGQVFKPLYIYEFKQDSRGRIWMGTEKGVAYISEKTDYAHSEAIVQPNIIDNNGENPLTNQTFMAICEDKKGQIWLGSEGLGIYVLSPDADEIVAHYTTENTAMPSNGIMSLAKDETGIMYVGTADGLASYDEDALPTEDTKLTEEEELETGSMQRWRLHLSYSNPQSVVATPNTIYAEASGALFGLDRKDETLTYWNKSEGLNGSTVAKIAYDKSADRLVIGYESGLIDLLDDKDGSVTQIPDLYIKAGAISTNINSIYVGSRCTYLAMTFGIIAINTKKAEMIDTYYIGADAQAINVDQVVEVGDSIYAFGENKMYSASLNDNMVDYSYWHSASELTDRLQTAAVYRNTIYTLQHDSLYRWEHNTWHLVRPEAFSWMHVSGGKLLLCVEQSKLYYLTDEDQLSGLCDRYVINDAVYTEGEYWLGEADHGLIRLGTNGDNYYHTNGPNSNTGYSMHAAHGQIYSTIGGRWATEFIREARLNIYNGSVWKGIDERDIEPRVGERVLDPVSIAVDPQDAGHFYMATYGTGVIEFRDYTVYKQHTTGNSTLKPANANVNPVYFTRTDGAVTDAQGNLWVLNITGVGQPLHVMTPDGTWHALNLQSGGKNYRLYTPGGIWMDRRNNEYKWFVDARVETGVFLFHDKGTPTYGGDDYCVKRSSFVDQDGKTVSPIYFRTLTQDLSNRIWIGTEKGLIIIPSNVDFFTSNSCRRIIIPRNDGTGLGDYLLGEEQINCMAVDGGNRMWIGTENSGLYLIEDDTITVAHFTERNSLLPSNTILSVAIEPTTGEVFVGTGKGIASYRSDASEARKDMTSAYAYPNPVRPDYGGIITIAGLMDNTVVNIIDAGGNLVCKTRSHGGTAVWNGKDAYGRRATPGVYTAMCNAEGGHTVVKILVMR